MSEARVSAKVSRSENEAADDQPDVAPKATKAKRHEIDVPMAEADIRLAEKLDNCLKISDARKSRFFMNKPNKMPTSDGITSGANLASMGSIKPKNLSREELRERLLKKYDTLVPELNPERTSVKLVKILSAKESLEIGKEEAKKQLVSQMKLNSISGNHRAYVDGIDSFRFRDGYEMPCKSFYTKRFDAFQRSKNDPPKTSCDRMKEDSGVTQEKTTTKSVKFIDQHQSCAHDAGDKAPNPYDIFAPDDDDEEDDDDDDILIEEDERQESDVVSGGGKRDVCSKSKT